MDKLFKQTQYIASAPDSLFLLTRLRLNKDLKRLQITADRVPILIDFLQDYDTDIVLRAQELLVNLPMSDAQIALLEYFILETPAFLTPIIKRLNFKTERLDLLSMAYFMAEEWHKYEGIDFNQQYLSFYFSNAPELIRKKILLNLQRCGRPHYTSILFPKSTQAEQKNLTVDEVKTSINLLKNYQNWDELWKLCQNTYLDLSLEIFQLLKLTDWQPQESSQKQLYYGFT